jgi:acyl-CoA thioesterase
MKMPYEIVSHMLNQDAFSNWLGIELSEVRAGYCKAQLTIRNEMLNGFHIAHGGIAYSLADSTLAFASNTYGVHCVSIETSISHVLKVQAHDVLMAECKEVYRGKKTAIYEVRVQNQNNELIALFKGTVFITQKEWEF